MYEYEEEKGDIFIRKIRNDGDKIRNDDKVPDVFRIEVKTETNDLDLSCITEA